MVYLNKNTQQVDIRKYLPESGGPVMKRTRFISFMILIALCLSCVPCAAADSEANAVKLTSGQVIYQKYGDMPVEITINNSCEEDCVVIQYEEYYNVFDNDYEGLIITKYFVGAGDSVTVNGPAGVYCYRAVFGDNYQGSETSHEAYSVQTGNFQNVKADYIVAKDVEGRENIPVKLDVSMDDADSSAGNLLSSYYSSANHTWDKGYYNERKGYNITRYSGNFLIFEIRVDKWTNPYSNGYFKQGLEASPDKGEETDNGLRLTSSSVRSLLLSDKPCYGDIVKTGDDKKITIPEDDEYLDEYGLKYIHSAYDATFVYQNPCLDYYSQQGVVKHGSVVAVLAEKDVFYLIRYVNGDKIARTGWVLKKFVGNTEPRPYVK